MSPEHEIRADFDKETIVVYQAYPPNIAIPAIANQRFTEPFSFHRMTWIKPSFLWLMHRSNWAQKSGQEHILAVRIWRSGWEQALSCGVLTCYDKSAHLSKTHWADAFAQAQIHVQWDPERNMRGAALQHGSIQVGIGREMIREYNDKWLVGITDMTPVVHKMRDLLRNGQSSSASRHLPPEKPYPLPVAIGRHLLIQSKQC